MQYKTIILVDGENLTLRYQNMKANGRITNDKTKHIQDIFVWNQQITHSNGHIDIIRTCYYTTVVGDEDRVREVKNEISESKLSFKTIAGGDWNGTLVPYVYKKGLKKKTTKSVDINLTIDALRYTYGNTVDQIILISGDGDYIPLLREVMSRGKMVQVWALSDGLHPDIKHNVDDLVILDDILFNPL